MLKILGLEEAENAISDIRKFLKKSQIYQINIPHKKKEVFIENKDIEFFDSLNVRNQVKKINEIKNDFDLCFVSSWSTARIAFLANLKYIIYFVGNDIRFPPFEKNFNKLNFIQRLFYKKILDSAIATVTGSEEPFHNLKKYRNDAIRIDRVVVDKNLFNPNVKPISIPKTKFTFFSPQRIGLEKGFDILWKALRICKTDFDVLQVDWIDDSSLEKKHSSKSILENKPEQIKLIPLLTREEIAKYYSFADGVLGDLKSGHANNIEREAALCRKPIVNYREPDRKYIIDRNEITSPFLPTKNDPESVAKLIDKIVDSEVFRKELAEQEYHFILEIGDPEKAGNEWDKLFEKIYSKYGIIKNKSSKIKSEFWMMIYCLGESLNFGRKTQLP